MAIDLKGWVGRPRICREGLGGLVCDSTGWPETPGGGYNGQRLVVSGWMAKCKMV